MMESKPVKGDASCVVDIGEGDLPPLPKMQGRLSEINPLLSGKSAVVKNSCIFWLPRRFRNMNGSSSLPQVVSIGPYHRDKAHLKRKEELKWRCLAYLVNSSETSLKHYLESIRSLEEEAKDCYAAADVITDLNSEDFLEMMVVDGCFIIEVLLFSYLRENRSNKGRESHPLDQMQRVTLPKIYSDLLLLENQIPYSVLKQLFEIFRMSPGRKDLRLSTISENVFSEILGTQYCEVISHERTYLHLLDLVRSIFIPPNRETWLVDSEEIPLGYRYIPLDTIPCISKLRRAGIKVKPRKKDNFLEVKFMKGEIEMPKIILNDLMCSFLVNSVAFEQCYDSGPKNFSVYALFLDCLVNSAGDVEHLCDDRVIENYIETDTKAASFINNLGKGLAFDLEYENFFRLCSCVNVYYQNGIKRQWTSFKREYVDKPWLWISGSVALVLLVLTLLQTYYTMNPKH